jgi:hypothetical protein
MTRGYDCIVIGLVHLSLTEENYKNLVITIFVVLCQSTSIFQKGEVVYSCM